jgi:hypothetical protein
MINIPVSDLFINRNKEINIIKTLEETTELNTELIKYVTKGKIGKFDKLLVAGEIADVLICLKTIMTQLEIEEIVENQLSFKIQKGENYAKKYGFRKNLNFEEKL